MRSGGCDREVPGMICPVPSVDGISDSIDARVVVKRSDVELGIRSDVNGIHTVFGLEHREVGNRGAVRNVDVELPESVLLADIMRVVVLDGMGPGLGHREIAPVGAPVTFIQPVPEGTVHRSVRDGDVEGCGIGHEDRIFIHTGPSHRDVRYALPVGIRHRVPHRFPQAASIYHGVREQEKLTQVLVRCRPKAFSQTIVVPRGDRVEVYGPHHLPGTVLLIPLYTLPYRPLAPLQHEVRHVHRLHHCLPVVTVVPVRGCMCHQMGAHGYVFAGFVDVILKESQELVYLVAPPFEPPFPDGVVGPQELAPCRLAAPRDIYAGRILELVEGEVIEARIAYEVEIVIYVYPVEAKVRHLAYDSPELGQVIRGAEDPRRRYYRVLAVGAVQIDGYPFGVSLGGQPVIVRHAVPGVYAQTLPVGVLHEVRYHVVCGPVRLNAVVRREGDPSVPKREDHGGAPEALYVVNARDMIAGALPLFAYTVRSDSHRV